MTDCQLYLITPPAIDNLDGFAHLYADVLTAGADTPAQVACLQLRLKDVTEETILRAAEALLPLCRRFDVALLINDHPHLARKAGADGVHIGQSDTPYDEARKILGPDASIGVTCHNSTHLAMEAGEAGADYVAFGAFYPTETKDVVHRADPDILDFWSRATTVPCVAIGGITPDNAAPLIEAGADFIAVSSALWNASDGPVAAMGRFAAVLGPRP
ncbi:thiamine phosphate synthase [Aquisalinus flavus]|uniref:Thiamine-phosphate synthase n=1 Tax=Aquisalinus flavus TaxID=1526572 RepID=A0A8J2V1K5_9PROT|nr:thiamine phosphate synthase [Aquisalinus flavus]MBD0426368.1 thiamine phosphate synthase [Aquisalinus flavus]UNE48067.1 thiamine phosphate synthase [Aquisalinus flavus]GGD08554.1 thiamine-phosphate synthase [Aquisalinus flavus]